MTRRVCTKNEKILPQDLPDLGKKKGKAVSVVKEAIVKPFKRRNPVADVIHRRGNKGIQGKQSLCLENRIQPGTVVAGGLQENPGEHHEKVIVERDPSEA